MEDKKNWNRNQKWLEEIEALKSILVKTDLVETTKWGGIVYTWNNRNIIGIGGFKDYFTIWFFNGVFLSDEKNVLVNAGEGVTKGLRQWRFTSKEEVNLAISPAVKTDWFLTSTVIFPSIESWTFLNLTCLRFRMISVTSSTTPSIVENSCTTPGSFTEVIA